MDSGATDNIVNRDDVFESYHDLPVPINIGVAKSGISVAATKRGKISATTNTGVSGHLENVLFCPEVPYNLLSVYQMQQNGLTTIFDSNGVKVKMGDKLILSGKPLNNLLNVIFEIPYSTVNLSISYMKNNYHIWHKRLSHISKEKFEKLNRF